MIAEAAVFPPTMVATESWPPNPAEATQLLHPRGAVVVADPDESPLPFADAAFDLVTSTHPATVRWSEIARVPSIGTVCTTRIGGSCRTAPSSRIRHAPCSRRENRCEA